MRFMLCILSLLALGCDDGEADFELIGPAETVSIVQGQTGTIEVAVDREGGFDQRIVVTASGLRAGITPGVLSLPADQDSGTLELAVETSAVAGVVDGAMLVGMAGELEHSTPVSLEILSR